MIAIDGNSSTLDGSQPSNQQFSTEDQSMNMEISEVRNEILDEDLEKENENSRNWEDRSRGDKELSSVNAVNPNTSNFLSQNNCSQNAPGIWYPNMISNKCPPTATNTSTNPNGVPFVSQAVPPKVVSSDWIPVHFRRSAPTSAFKRVATSPPPQIAISKAAKANSIGAPNELRTARPLTQRQINRPTVKDGKTIDKYFAPVTATSNRYQILEPEDGAGPSSSRNTITTSSAARNGRLPSEPVSSLSSNQAAKLRLPPTRKPSPIIATYPQADKAPSLLQDKTANTDAPNFTMRFIDIGIQFNPVSQDDHSEIKDRLSAANVPFYTHRPRHGKPFTAVLRGMPLRAIDELTEDLVEAGIPPTNIFPIQSKHPNPHKQLYRIEFDPQIDRQIVLATKFVGNVHVKWEKPIRREPRPTICFNCAMYGHGANGCNRLPVCVHCAGAHPIASCPERSNPNAGNSALCANCVAEKGEENALHRADDSSCTHRLAYMKFRASRRTPTQQKFTKSTLPLSGATQTASGRLARSQGAPQADDSIIFQTRRQSRARSRSRSISRHLSFADVVANRPEENRTDLRNRSRQRSESRQSHQQTRQSHSQRLYNQSGNDDMFTMNEVTNIIVNAVQQLRQCRNRQDQIQVIASILQQCL